jgi:rubredoxin---NAD+ reductase
MHPIVIIGSGMAGYTLAREFRKLNAEQALVMICADDATNYAKPTLSNALTAKKQPEQIALGDAEKMSAQLNMRIEKQAVVTRIDAENHQVYVEQNGENTVFDYSKLILALGASPIRLNIAGNANADIHVVNHINDYKAFRAEIDPLTEKRIAILGAGLIGCEFANDLQNAGYKTTVIDLATTPLSRLLPANVSSEFKNKLESSGIEFVLGTTVDKIEKANSVFSIELANGQKLETDVVLSAIGLQANTEIAEAANIATARGVTTNTHLETNQADIFAIGDCAEVEGTLLPYVMPIMQQARALAKTLNGDKTAVHYPAMPVAVKTPAAPLTVLPVPVNVDVNWETEVLEDGLIAKAVDSSETLRGFVLLGATAGKQRLALAKLVPDLIPASV